MKSLELLLQGISLDILLNIGFYGPYNMAHIVFFIIDPYGFMDNLWVYRKLEMISSVITIPPFI